MKKAGLALILVASTLIVSSQNIGDSKESRDRDQILNELDIIAIWVKEPKMVYSLMGFFGDSLKLPVEWNPIDLFGNKGILDGAINFGNVTVEFLSFYDSIDFGMNQSCRYQW